ncbi:hypothetical protein DV495_001561 [Geotrichum candidum]|nr:hypothetical protein DV452_004845 [Geotrichum candidum]KAI9210024.1 hypothetical protein DS838_005093 [Geotrichum bryndzae]KAF5112264.1 hypothetical protein DV454_004306 [Geotrichum candidum]KAF5132154.1 hypothetical protein DV495_001561 [Geotrichum candidum]KAF7496957.1 hypothetical protein DV113_005008 [Geotrichum candidum]
MCIHKNPKADSVLKRFQDHPDAWTRAPKILQDCKQSQSKYIALSILDKIINTRWKALPSDERNGIKNFVAQLCVSWSNDDSVFKAQRALLNKANLTLVQILKQEWPANWPNFIPEIVGSSRTGLNVCENNMTILKLLCEEVFDFSAEQMTSVKAKTLKRQMREEFLEIYKLCIEVLENADRPSLINATLQCLLRYFHWVQLSYIFETPIIELLVTKFLAPPEFRNVTLKCLTEIATTEKVEAYEPILYQMFVQSMTVVHGIIPSETNFKFAYESAGSLDQEFIQNLALFLSAYLSKYLKSIENQNNQALLEEVHLYLIKISQIEEREVFKICLDYWARLVAELYQEIEKIPISDLNPMVGHNFLHSFNAGGAANPETLAHYPLRKHKYNNILSSLRLVMIEKMVRPEEVLIVENDEGEIVREFVKESDTITLYKSIREVLVYLTHLDVVDTERIMTEKLARQSDGSEWSWNNLNTLCWAMGSISGAMNEEMEKHFLVLVIKELLSLTEKKKGKDNKAVVASNIMYIVGQYPRFLKAHWKFLKTVVNKLFEFMHETHEGVQDMACDTFIKIAIKCKRHFVALQQQEDEPFIEEIIRKLPDITSDLQPQQVQTFYEACGHIISAQNVKNIRERLLTELMRLPNMAWNGVIEQSKSDPELLTNPDNIKIIANIMKTNVSTCSSLGASFYSQLKLIYIDMLHLYRAVSQMISDAVAQQGDVATKTPRVRGLRTIKKEILKLIEAYISKAEDLDDIVNELASPLLGAVLSDYRTNVPDAREAEVLHCMNTLVNRVGKIAPEMVLNILENVFECTLDMINKTMNDYPEHRVEFFKLLRTINLESFPALLKLPEDVFKQTIDACLWGVKHDNREVESSGLYLTLELMTNMGDMHNELSHLFFKMFFKPIINDILYVLTDSDHKAGFKIQSQILAKFIDLCESNSINGPLYTSDEAPENTSNLEYFKIYFCSILISAFNHLQLGKVELFFNSLVQSHRDPVQFKQILRDFLVELKEFGGDDTSYLYVEDREKERLEREAEERERAKKIGGLIKPNDLDEDDL